MAEHGREKASPAGAFGKTSRKTFDWSWTKKHGDRTHLSGDGWWKARLEGDYYRMLSASLRRLYGLYEGAEKVILRMALILLLRSLYILSVASGKLLKVLEKRKNRARLAFLGK